MKVLFLSHPGTHVDRLILALRLRWTDLEPVIVSRSNMVLSALREEPPELVVVCEALSELDIVASIKLIRKSTDVPLMIVTEDEDDDQSTNAVRALEMGADDYISLPTDLMEVMARAVALIRRAQITQEKSNADNPITCGELTIIPSTYEAFLGPDQVMLTPTEFKLLYLLARNAGMILSREALRKMLWINDFYCGDALKKYVQRLRSKLGDDAKNPEWIKTVHGVGYMLAQH